MLFIKARKPSAQHLSRLDNQLLLKKWEPARSKGSYFFAKRSSSPLMAMPDMSQGFEIFGKWFQRHTSNLIIHVSRVFF
jgi:hypothetical protein